MGGTALAHGNWIGRLLEGGPIECSMVSLFVSHPFNLMLKVSESEIRKACALPADSLPFSRQSGSQGAQPEMSVDEILAEIQRAADLPFEDSITLPAQAYTSPEFFDWEVENIFRKEWYCVGRADSLSAPGDYVACELAGQAIIVLRDKESNLRAMSNVCLHRMSTLLHGRGNAKTIVCPYHAWTYNLDGKLRGAPAMTQNEGFCKDHYALPQIR